MNDSIYSKSKSLHEINIWNDDTNNVVMVHVLQFLLQT